MIAVTRQMLSLAAQIDFASEYWISTERLWSAEGPTLRASASKGGLQLAFDNCNQRLCNKAATGDLAFSNDIQQTFINTSFVN